MATQTLTTAKFSAVTEGEGIVSGGLLGRLVRSVPDRFAPIYEKVSEKHEDIVFAKVDTEAEQDLADRVRDPVDPDHHGDPRRCRRLPAAGRPARGGCSSR